MCSGYKTFTFSSPAPNLVPVKPKIHETQPVMYLVNGEWPKVKGNLVLEEICSCSKVALEG